MLFPYRALWSASPPSQRLRISSATSPYTEPLGTFFGLSSSVVRGRSLKRLPLLFAVALPIGLAQKQPARCCLEALVAYFAYCFFLSEIVKLSGDNLGLKYPSSLTSASGITIIDGIKTLDTGIIGPLAVSATVVAIHDRFYDAKFPIGSAPSRAPRWSTSSAFLPCLPLPLSRPPSCPPYTQ